MLQFWMCYIGTMVQFHQIIKSNTCVHNQYPFFPRVMWSWADITRNCNIWLLSYGVALKFAVSSIIALLYIYLPQFYKYLFLGSEICNLFKISQIQWCIEEVRCTRDVLVHVMIIRGRGDAQQYRKLYAMCVLGWEGRNP